MRRAGRAFFGWGGWAKLASMVTTLAALAALWFTNQSLRATSEQYGLSRQTAVTERFAKAVEQLGNSSSMDVRLGGIQLLRKLADDSEQDRVPILQTFATFVRTHAPNGPDCGTTTKQLDIDVQTALTAIGSRKTDRTEAIDLSGTCLARANLYGANLQNVTFRKSNLTRSLLEAADLRSALLFTSNLAKADLSRADLRHAAFNGGTLQDAHLKQAKLDGAAFVWVDMRKADLGSTTMQGANFSAVDLRGASFGEGFKMTFSSSPLPDLETVEELHLAGAQLNGSRFDEDTLWPTGVAPKSMPYRPRQYANYCPGALPMDDDDC